MINDLIKFTTLIKSRKKNHGFFIIINVLRVKILLRRRNFLVVIVLTISRKIYFIFLALNCSVVVQPTIPTKHKKSGLKQTWGYIFLESEKERNYACIFGHADMSSIIMPKLWSFFLLILSMIMSKKILNIDYFKKAPWMIIKCEIFFHNRL